MAEFIVLDRKAVRRILTDELHMRKIFLKVVPNILSHDQKLHRKDMCLDMLAHIVNEPNLQHVMRHGFLPMAQKVSTSRCSESLQDLQDPKKANMSGSKFMNTIPAVKSKIKEIGCRVERNQTTVMWICDRWMQEGTMYRRGRLHPPQCTTSYEDRQIVRMAVTDRSVTA
ncbi:transposable element Tcb1 transposase [Trichonephila clavipes]|nr:transposable element Tcb1 transposase [Trichonephila clavipes]